MRTEVIARTTVPSDVSEPELSVLAALYQSAGQRRQSDLARELRWDRTRLSHLLTRMTRRGYVQRTKEGAGMTVELLPGGVELIEAAAPGLEVALQQYLVDRLGSRDARTLRTFLERLDNSD
ncbi:MAG TPA: MarR family transcriptional regulator [Actinomycetaceae bacterium]|nr:MarR family transcriptional regulator [Actinomycetaceae bacterium]